MRASGLYQRLRSSSTTRLFSSKISAPKYTLAISRQVPESFPNALTKYAQGQEPIFLDRAHHQHEFYLESLRKYVPTLCLPPLNFHADSVFVEDTVVAIGKQAVITKPGHPSRQGEVDTIQDCLKQLGIKVTDMRDSADAICDGGDVLYSGRHLFVGLSARTNLEAVKVLEKAFGIETIAVPFADEALHLKSVVTHMDPTTLLVPAGAFGDEVLQAMQADKLGYEAIRLPDIKACNVVSVNGAILAQDIECGESRQMLLDAAAKRNLTVAFVSTSEMAKCDGALTCCSVLLSI